MSSLRGVTQEELHELFYYRDGKLFNNRYRGRQARKDEEAGGNSGYKDEYKKVGIRGYYYKTHRLVWVFHYGDIPTELQVDHINGNKFDNRIENLRLVTAQENLFNRKAKGYYWETARGQWNARIGINGVKMFLGRFDTEVEARTAYLKAKAELHIIKDRSAFLCP